MGNQVSFPSLIWFNVLISPDGNVGLTFGHILASQFDALRSGDRFFFTHENGAENFNPRQGSCTYDVGKIFVFFYPLASPISAFEINLTKFKQPSLIHLLLGDTLPLQTSSVHAPHSWTT